MVARGRRGGGGGGGGGGVPAARAADAMALAKRMMEEASSSSSGSDDDAGGVRGAAPVRFQGRASSASSDDDEGVTSAPESVDSDEEAMERERVLEAMREGKAVFGQPAVNNVDGLTRKRAAVALNGGRAVDFIDTFAVTAPVALRVADINDDLKRELAFYEMTLAGVNVGLHKLEERGVNWRRPDGSRKGEPPFLAEMLKSDAHMARVKDTLLLEKHKIEAVEERRHERMLRKYGKQMQAEKKQQRDKQRRVELDKIKTLRRNLKDVDTELDLEDQLEQAQSLRASSGSKGGRKGGALPHKSKKREAKDSRFGFGGKKRHAKSNTSDSTNDVTGFSIKRNKGGYGKRPLGAKGGIHKRPGKSRRQTMHARRK